MDSTSLLKDNWWQCVPFVHICNIFSWRGGFCQKASCLGGQLCYVYAFYPCLLGLPHALGYPFRDRGYPCRDLGLWYPVNFGHALGGLGFALGLALDLCVNDALYAAEVDGLPARGRA